MNGIYVEDWKKHGGLVRAVRTVFDRWDIRMDYGIWCPYVWANLKKETQYQDALLNITMESQALQAWDCLGGFVNFQRDMNKVADVRDCYWERGFHWSIHLYPKGGPLCSIPAKL